MSLLPTLKRRRRRGSGISLLALAILLVALWQPSGAPVATKKLVPSRETTYLVAPAREDGTIDYAQALALPGSDETPEEDAAPLLMSALAAAPDRPDARALDLALAAADRPRFHSPRGGTLCERPLRPASLRPLVEALCARAIERADVAEIAAAMKELGAARRIARMVAPPATLEERATAEASARHAWASIESLARDGRGRPAAELARLAAEEERTPFDTALREGLADTRIDALDRLSAIYRGAAAESALFARARESAAAAKGFGGLDPNRVFRRFNAQWDRVEAALLDGALPWPERATRLAELRAEIEKTARDGPPKPKDRQLPWISSPDERADQLADQVVALLVDSTTKTLPTWIDDFVAVDRAVAEVAALAFAAQNGRDPATSDEIPATSEAAPRRDRLLSQPWSFSRAADGALTASGPAAEVAAAFRAAVEQER